VDEDVRIAFLADGTGSVFGADTPATLAYTATFLETCAFDATAGKGYVEEKGPVACDTLTSPSGCTRDACGICSCPQSMQFPNFDSWRLTQGKLSFGGGAADHCLVGDSLAIRKNEVIYTLRRAQPGTPAPCAARSTAACNVVALSKDCHIGRCEWVPSQSSSVNNCDPDEDTESGCEITFGCEWNTSVCGGAPSASCEPEDFGKVPGCEFHAPGTTCEGEPTGCEARNAVDCKYNPGCSLFTGCTGGVRSCVDVAAETRTCYLSSGCKEGAGSSCTGTIDCSQIKIIDGCKPEVGCTWVVNGCAGTAPPCNTYSLGECEYRGCKLAAP
jgi:hypothetical protein